MGKTEGSTPTPGFEGFEKRLEVEFYTREIQLQGSGLRAISRAEIDKMLRAAECTIVSQLCNHKFDSYVLSESSLFVYPLKIVIKTCGTTQILRTIPQLLASAARLFLHVRKCRYSRGSFLFPHSQPFPHGSFAEEIKILDTFFKNLGSSGSKALVMGDPSKNQNWHVYVASVDEVEKNLLLPEEPTFTLEICMTGLEHQISSQFYKAAMDGSVKNMTVSSGISDLLPNSQICDFAFDPCGYSMNGMEDNAHSTIHITPEEGFSYASFETMGYGPRIVDLQTLVDRVAECFKPTFLSISVFVCGDLIQAVDHVGSWNGSVCPCKYVCDGSSRKNLPGKSAVVYHTFRKSSHNCNYTRPCSLFPLPEEKQNLGNDMKKLSIVGDEALCWNKHKFLAGEQPFLQFLKHAEDFVADKDLSSYSGITDEALSVLDLRAIESRGKSLQSSVAEFKSTAAEMPNTKTDLLSVLAEKISELAFKYEGSENGLLKLKGTDVGSIIACKLYLDDPDRAKNLCSYIESKENLENLIKDPLGNTLIFFKAKENAADFVEEKDNCKSTSKASEIVLKEVNVPLTDGLWSIGSKLSAIE